MPNTNQKTKEFIRSLKGEMTEWGITSEDVAIQSKKSRLNIGKGYSHQQVRNYLNNRSAMPSGLADLILQMIEHRIAHHQVEIVTLEMMAKRLDDAKQARNEIQSQTL